MKAAFAGASSNFSTATTGPGAFGSFAVTNATSGFNLQWADVARAVDYDIYRGTSSSSINYLDSTGSTATVPYNDTTVTAATPYWYYIVAVDASGGYSVSPTVGPVTPSTGGGGPGPGGGGTSFPTPSNPGPTGSWKVMATELFTDPTMPNWIWNDSDTGVPGGDNQDVRWKQSQVQVVSVGGVNELQLTGQKPTSGNLAGKLVGAGGDWINLPAAQQTAPVLVQARVKFDASPAGWKGVGMLFDYSFPWPTHGELDFWEFSDGGRNQSQMNVHYDSTAGQGTHDEYDNNDNDWTQWHWTEWYWLINGSDTYCQFWSDGVKRCDSNGGSINVPTSKIVPLTVTFQLDVSDGVPTSGFPTSERCVMHVQSVRVLKPT